MSQTYETLVSGTTTFGQLYGKINNLAEALRSCFCGNSFPTTPSPTLGQLCFRTDLNKLYVFTASGWSEVAIELTGLGAEIINARGSKPSLDQRLDVSLNEDGTLKSNVSAYQSQWILPSLTFTYVDATTFQVNGDQRDIYTATRRLKINLTSSVAYSEVVSSSYDSGQNKTTITIADAVLTSNLVSIEHSIISPIDANGAITKQMLNIKVESNVIKIKEGSNWVSGVEDADKVDGYHASQTPSADTIPVGRADGRLNANWVANGLDIRAGGGDHYLEPNSQLNGVKLLAGTIIPLFNGSVWKVYEFTSDVNITTLDTGSFQFGKDYYVYLCDDGSASGLLLISLNSTAPSGYNANNSRKIGGFHFGRKRNSFTPSDITNNVVVPNSVWDLVHRPRCSPEGMVYIGSGVWVDIYLVSVNEAITFTAGNGSPLLSGTGKSTYNSTPLTGTEGLNGYNFIELAYRSGKRLLTYAEWLRAAYGSPQGNSSDNINAWTATTNTQRQTTGYVERAISLMNVIDCVGNVWEWLDEFSIRQDGTSWGWRNPMSGQGVGQLYLPYDLGLVQFICGGDWSDGAYAGSRTVHLDSCPWYVHTLVGSRFACDSL